MCEGGGEECVRGRGEGMCEGRVGECVREEERSV